MMSAKAIWCVEKRTAEPTTKTLYRKQTVARPSKRCVTEAKVTGNAAARTKSVPWAEDIAIRTTTAGDVLSVEIKIAKISIRLLQKKRIAAKERRNGKHMNWQPALCPFE